MGCSDYFRGGNRIPWYVAGMSIFATMLSSITFIAVPTQTYLADWRYYPMVICIFAIAPIAIYYYLPFFCRLGITSAYEYLEKRFNLGVRLFGSAAFVVFMVCRVAVVTLLPAIALNAVTGVSIDACILICGVLTMVYCSLGGLEAVIWSDFIQGLVMLVGIAAIIWAILASKGGLAAALDGLARVPGPAMLPGGEPTPGIFTSFLGPDPLNLLFVVILTSLGTWGLPQMVQKFYAIKNEGSIKKGTIISTLFAFVVAGGCYFLGGFGRLFSDVLKVGPNGVPAGGFDAIIPKMLEGLSPMLIALVVVLVLSASMSTLSSLVITQRHSFLWLSSIPLCKCTKSSLSIHLLVDM